MDRRSFLQVSSMATLGASCGIVSCSDSAPIPVIDTHQHLWDLDLFPLGWVKPPLHRNYLMEDYLEAVRGHHVEKAVYMEVGVPASLKKKEVEWVLKICEDPDNPTVAAVISADPSQQDFGSYMTGFEGNPYLKGIRYSLRGTDKKIPARIINNVRLLGKLGFSMDMNPSPGRLVKSVEILDLCPDVRFILDHCGNPDPVAFLSADKELPREPKHDRDEWYRDIEQIAQRPNIVCKISGIVDNVIDYPLKAEDLAPAINHCIEQFGPDRVMFGGDWPVCLRNMSLGGWIDMVRKIVRNRPVREQKKLLYNNALDFYGLEEPTD